MYLLDTNVISELRLCARGRGNANVLNWAKTCTQDQFFTSVVVMMEIQKGILHRARKDKLQAQVLQEWFSDIVQPTFENKVLTIDNETATVCAKLHIPDPAPANDAWIAATAMQHNLTLVTRNISDFNIKGLKVFNPFD